MTMLSVLACIACLLGLTAGASGADGPHVGFLFDEFNLTLDSGHRTEAVGPFFYSEERDTQRTWAVPPLFSRTEDPATDSEEIDVVYPVITYDRFGDHYRWHIFQLLSFAGGPTQTEDERERFTIFPVYFRQKSSVTNENYTAVLPFYGRLKNRLFREEIFFVMFPFYIQSRKADVVTDNYLYPFFHRRQGTALSGWQLWPFYGIERKDVTTKTNGFNEVQTIAGHDKFFLLWPFYFQQKAGIGADNPQWIQGSIPAYSLLRSPQRDSTTVLWPFFSWIDDREKKYREWEVPWPFVVIARGEGKTMTRVSPFFSRGHNAYLENISYLWPVYKYSHLQSAPLDRTRTRICFFLYSDTKERNTETGAARHRVDCWPLYTWRRDFNGNTRFQVLALLEPYLPNNKSADRDYSPLWSFWRSERNPRTGAASQSLLWNLYRRETTPDCRKTSLFFGLYQERQDAQGKRARWFFQPQK